MAVYSYERIKQIWENSPRYGNTEVQISSDDPFGDFDREGDLDRQQSEYMRRFDLEDITGPSVSRGVISYRVDPLEGDSYYVTKQDAQAAVEIVRDGETAEQSRQPPSTEQESSVITSNPESGTEETDPFAANQAEIDIDDQQDIDEDLTELIVNFERTANTLHIEVVDGLGVVESSYTISKEDYESYRSFTNTEPVNDVMRRFRDDHRDLLDILLSRISVDPENSYRFEEYPVRPETGDLSSLPGMDEFELSDAGFIGKQIPELPITDADVERFKTEMREANLLFGDGGVVGIPEQIQTVGEVETLLEQQPEEIREDLPSLEEESRVKQKANLAEKEQPKAPSKVKPGSQPAIMLEGMARDVEPNVGKGPNTGLLDRPLPEPVPFYDKCSSDKVVSGKNNTWIVLGRDRPGGLSTGYGPGQGHTQAGAIDICVGRMSPKPISFDSRGRKIQVGPLFSPVPYSYENGETLTVMDAARIYISQKTDLDDNFSLNLPPKTRSSRAVSGIAMKADGIRIMSRKEGIRLVTENADSISSKGGVSGTEPFGICLIAANKASELQPIIKGDFLTHLLTEMLDNQAQIAGAIASIKQDMIEVNCALLLHEHVNPVTGPTVKLPALTAKTMEKVIKQVSVDTFSAFSLQQNPEVIQKTYLEDGGKASIKSKYNKVN